MSSGEPVSMHPHACLPFTDTMFRLDTGIPGYNGKVHMGCYPYWNGQDLWGLRNDAPLNLLYFDGAGSARAMHVPSADVIMRR